MKEAYAEKQKNQLFLTQPNLQCLSDLHLIKESELTYASLILLGQESAIQRLLPQSAIFLEYRNDIGQITFDDRRLFYQPYLIAIEKIWNFINLRNGQVPVQQGPYIFDIPYFNKEVIREAINTNLLLRHFNAAYCNKIIFRAPPPHICYIFRILHIPSAYKIIP